MYKPIVQNLPKAARPIAAAVQKYGGSQGQGGQGDRGQSGQSGNHGGSGGQGNGQQGNDNVLDKISGDSG